MTKVCIFGAGSIGGYIAACLKKTDVDVSLVARGPHKEAIEKNKNNTTYLLSNVWTQIQEVDRIRQIKLHVTKFAI